MERRGPKQIVLAIRITQFVTAYSQLRGDDCYNWDDQEIGQDGEQKLQHRDGREAECNGVVDSDANARAHTSRNFARDLARRTSS